MQPFMPARIQHNLFIQMLPDAQHHLIQIHSPLGNSVYQLRFNQSPVIFPKEYMKARKGVVQFEIPEVYELANIIWTLSPAGKNANNLYRKGDYYNRLVNYFKPFLHHPLFQKLNDSADSYLKNYYDFRENSMAYSFKDDSLVYSGPYYYILGNDYWTFNSLFKTLLPLIQDFSSQSRFRIFYQNNKDYYKRLIEEEKKNMPVKDMWDWLEKEFPGAGFSSYKIVFSPLIGSSHSTQQFWDVEEADKFFSEVVAFVSGPEHLNVENLTTQKKQALASAIVFTEIDHNYVNPVSNKYTPAIDSIFSQRAKWVSGKKDTKMYPSGMDIFNEYMTHAVFCLYATDRYDEETARFIINQRTILMKDQRGFILFEEFTGELQRLRKDLKQKKIAELYPEFIRRLQKSSIQ